MDSSFAPDKSNGYEQHAQEFIRRRSPVIGVKTVLEWSRSLAAGTEILDVGCGSGAPISQALVNAGFRVSGVDASAALVAAFHDRFPDARVECSAVEDSAFFSSKFDAVVAWGLMFLLPAELQVLVIRKIAGALNPGGRFLFTSPREAVSWMDVMTRLPSISLGVEGYRRILEEEHLTLAGHASDEGDNFYYFVVV